MKRQILSAIDGGWEVDSSDVPEALDLFVEYFGEEDALEQIAQAMGSDTLEENIDWIAQQWGFAEDLEDIEDAWEKYETAKEIMGSSELFTELTKAAGYDELAEDLAFIFRMNDFREWDKYDNDDSGEEIESSRKAPVWVKNAVKSFIRSEKELMGKHGKMKYGIQSTDSGCDYTEFSTLEECKEWVLSNLYELERNNARYIQITNVENPDEIIFYENVEWHDGVSNLKQIAEKIK